MAHEEVIKFRNRFVMLLLLLLLFWVRLTGRPVKLAKSFKLFSDWVWFSKFKLPSFRMFMGNAMFGELAVGVCLSLLAIILDFSSFVSLLMLVFGFWDIFSSELLIVFWTLIGLGAGFWKLSTLLLLLLVLLPLICVFIGALLTTGLALAAFDLLLHMASCFDKDMDDWNDERQNLQINWVLQSECDRLWRHKLENCVYALEQI